LILLPSEPRSFLGPDSISVSELAALARCEWAWNASYVGERPESAKSAAMARGTEVHRLVQHWRNTGYVLASDDEVSAWLIKRYAAHYAPTDRGIRTLATELPYAVRLLAPYDGHLFGFIDGVVTTYDGMWLHEIKTMKDWSRLSQLPVDMQVSLYIWAARQSGLPVRGVMYDAIRTQRWVRGPERPTAESFERIWIERTDEQIDSALEQLHSALDLRWSLTERAPLKNIGQACSWCPHIAACYDLAIEILDDDPAVEAD
jgi:hypothetical protein